MFIIAVEKSNLTLFKIVFPAEELPCNFTIVSMKHIESAIDHL